MTTEAATGALRLTKAELHHLPTLRAIYELEAARVAGPGSARRDIRTVLWTVSDVVAHLGGGPEAAARVASLVELLKERGQLIEIARPDGPLYVTRTAETVRLLGHGYEYWRNGRTGIEAVRWLVEDKRVPRREVPAREAIDAITRNLNEAGLTRARPNLARAVAIAVEAVARAIARQGDWENARFSRFQIDAAVSILRGATRGSRPHQLLVADVGSGKTAAFQIGALADAIDAVYSGERRIQLLLYPRTALSQNQYDNIHTAAEAVVLAGGPRIIAHYEHSSHYRSIGESVAQGVRRVFQGASTPHIVVTTLETLKRRLHRPEFVQALRSSLRRIVLDEIHLVEGTSGTNVVRLLERVRATTQHEVLWTGVSATVATPELHGSTVFGVHPSTIDVVLPRTEDLEEVGLVHHVFLKPNGTLSTLGTLVNTTSVLVHSRRQRLGDRPPRNRLQKTVAFADNLDALGRWNADFRENERTEETRERPHPNTADITGWNARSRELPYAHRFWTPFSRRLRASDAAPALYPVVLRDAQTKDPCGACYSGQRIVIGKCSPEDLRQLGRFVYRNPVRPDDSTEPYLIQHEAFERTEDIDIGTLDLCPFLQSGTCIRFAEQPPETEPVPGTATHEWRHVARSKLHHSKTGGGGGEDHVSDDLEDIVFTAPAGEVYGGRARDQIPVDVVFASPSLEVGVDLPNVTEEVMFKAIRNIASYRQKAGRAGREEGTDTMIVTLLTQRAVDFHYYRQPRKLVRTGSLDPVPLKRHNRPLLVSALYVGVWDHLAREGIYDDYVQPAVFEAMLRNDLDHLRNARPQVEAALRRQTRDGAEPEDIRIAIDQVVADIELLLTPTDGLFEGDAPATVAGLVTNFISKRKKPIAIRREVLAITNEIEKAEADLATYQAQVDELAAGAAPEVREIRRSRDRGWALAHLEPIIASLDEKLRDEGREAKRYVRALEDVREALQDLERLDPKPSVEALQYHRQLERVFGEATWKGYYLSYHLSDLPIFKARRAEGQGPLAAAAFVLPNLFTNPYEPRVQLVKRQLAGRPIPLGDVSIAEALFTAVPGTWTYRLGPEPLKALCGRMLATPGGTLMASLRNLQAHHDLVQIRTGVRGPPWVAQDFSVWRPTKVTLQWAPKYVFLDQGTGLVGDKDEADPQGRTDNTRVKIPQTFQERWLDIREESTEPILCNGLDADQMNLETPQGTLRGEDARARIRHPLLAGPLSDVLWHERLRVCEFIHSVGRAYTSREGSGVSVEFEDDGHPVGLGHEFMTEGVSIMLRPEAVRATVDVVVRGVLDEGGVWAATTLKALSAVARSAAREDPDREVSPFVLRDFIRLVVADQSADPQHKLTLRDLLGRIKELAENGTLLRQRATEFVHAKRDITRREVEEEGGAAPPAQLDDRGAREVENLVHAAKVIARSPTDPEAAVREWAEFSLLNTFGVVATHALQRLSGVPEERIGYFPDTRRAEKGEYRVFLYDRDEHGNGACRLLRDNLHILYIQRLSHKDEKQRMLPTEDYLTILEQELLQCPQYHVDMSALQMHAQTTSGATASGHLELREYQAHASEVHHVGNPVWRTLGLAGPADGWRLPVLHLVHGTVAHEHDLEADDVYRATGICWNGCPECVLSDSGLLGAVTGRDYLDKHLLDHWFEQGITRSDAYEHVPLSDLAAGTRPLRVGAKTGLYLEADGKRHRAVALPFTVGLSVDRASAHAPRMLFRSGDFEGHLLDAEPDPHGAGPLSVGLSRLLWYQLLASSYLASVDRLSTSERKVKMVFYDLRDVALDDSAFSEKMRASLETMKAAQGRGRPITTLAEMMRWMTTQGFSFEICVDGTRAGDPSVAHFLREVGGLDGGRVRVLTKNLEKAAMHAKGILTPIGGLYGSANLTTSGSRRNDEMVRYVRRGSPEYRNLEVALDDILAQAAAWDARTRL